METENKEEGAGRDRLEGLRQELDTIDSDFVDLLVRRQNAVKRVADVKSRTDAPLRDVLRESRQIARLAERARSQGLDDLFVVRMFRELDPRAGEDGDLDVPDPYFGGDEGFERVLAMVERTSDALVEALAHEASRPVGSGD